MGNLGLDQAYIALQKIVFSLYAEAEQAINEYASLLQSQADNLYQVAENLEILIAEVEWSMMWACVS